MSITPAMLNQINTGSFINNWLVLFEAKNRITGANERLGLWTGLDNINVNLPNGMLQQFIGTGQLLEVPMWSYAIGAMAIQRQRISVNIYSPEIATLIRNYDASLAPVTVYLMIRNPEDESIVGISEWFAGMCDEININEDAESGSCEIAIVSDMRNGTRTLIASKSDADQRTRDPNDAGFKYAATAGSTSIRWGMGKGYKSPNFIVRAVTQQRDSGR